MKTTSEAKSLLDTDHKSGDRVILVMDRRLLKVDNMLANKPKTKILVDGGGPEETLRVKQLLGFVDGQTTNPTLIAKNPHLQRRIASGHTLSP